MISLNSPLRNIPKQKEHIKKKTEKEKIIFMLLFSANLLFPSSPWWWCWGLQAAALPGADGVGGGAGRCSPRCWLIP